MFQSVFTFWLIRKPTGYELEGPVDEFQLAKG